MANPTYVPIERFRREVARIADANPEFPIGITIDYTFVNGVGNTFRADYHVGNCSYNESTGNVETQKEREEILPSRIFDIRRKFRGLFFLGHSINSTQSRDSAEVRFRKGTVKEILTQHVPGSEEESHLPVLVENFPSHINGMINETCFLPDKKVSDNGDRRI